jgi:hypothetical protein
VPAFAVTGGINDNTIAAKIGITHREIMCREYRKKMADSQSEKNAIKG